jgi:hypothetical protein
MGKHKRKKSLATSVRRREDDVLNCILKEQVCEDMDQINLAQNAD